jgi:putative transcriptional regulator
VVFFLFAKITRQIGKSSAPVTIATLFTVLALLCGMPSTATAFSLQFVALPFFPSPLTSPPGPYQSQSALAKGKFLVASRRLGDPNFAETVVLLIEFGQSGTMGVVINRPTEAPLSTLLPAVKALQQRTDPVYLGGPVGRSQMIILARSSKPPEGSLQVFADVYTIGGQTVLQKILDQSGTDAKFRAYLGYAGWAAGQLEMEVSQGGWYIVPADAAAIFDKAATDIWPELIRSSEAEWVRDFKPDRWLLLSARNERLNLAR